jgi:hypothetical protein
MTRYIIRGGLEGKKRLEILAMSTTLLPERWTRDSTWWLPFAINSRIHEQ